MIALVTGATGFVGSHILGALLDRGERVRALVRDSKKGHALRDRGVEVVEGDLLDPSALVAAVSGAGPIYHCAAAVGPERSLKDIIETNLTGVRRLCDAVATAKAGRIVLLSSINVLGTRHLDPATEDLSCCRSHDPAADVKIDAEQVALEKARQDKIDVVIVRPGFIYGPGDSHNLPTLVDSIRKGRFAFIGSRHNIVPLVHVADVAQAMVLAGAAPGASGRTYHVGDGSRTTIGDLVDLVARLQGCPAPRRVVPFFLAQFLCVAFELRARLGPTLIKPPISRAGLRFVGTSRFVDISRARTELGYEPSISYREGVAAAIQRIPNEHLPRATHVPDHPAFQESA
jgi:nucleoside-diphosphate-sugar epimerase